jgi:hypothetical protein
MITMNKYYSLRGVKRGLWLSAFFIALWSVWSTAYLLGITR